MSVAEQAVEQVEVKVAYDIVSWWERPDLKGQDRQHRHAGYGEVVRMPASEAERLRTDSPGSLVDPDVELRAREHARRPPVPEAPTSPESADPDARDGAANEYTQQRADDDDPGKDEADSTEEALDEYMAMDRRQLVAFAKRHGVVPAPRESKSSLSEKLVARGVLPPPPDELAEVEDHAMTVTPEQIAAEQVEQIEQVEERE